METGKEYRSLWEVVVTIGEELGRWEASIKKAEESGVKPELLEKQKATYEKIMKLLMWNVAYVNEMDALRTFVNDFRQQFLTDGQLSAGSEEVPLGTAWMFIEDNFRKCMEVIDKLEEHRLEFKAEFEKLHSKKKKNAKN